MLDKIDALCIVTPTVTSCELALTAIETGKHLFIEKPLTDNQVTLVGQSIQKKTWWEG
jgi:predicted dehydrogenase